MLGVGFIPPKRRLVTITSASEDQTRWWTIDNNPDCKPHKLFDLERLELGEQLPFEHQTFDEIHAYEVLEHFGRQGNFRGLFATFRALWTVLKSGGYLMGTCPSMGSKWLYAEPGHTRVIALETLVFLTRGHYDQLGKTACSDYRKFVEPCWWIIENTEDDGENFSFWLRRPL